jgi:hypothetical protein
MVMSVPVAMAIAVAVVISVPASEDEAQAKGRCIVRCRINRSRSRVGDRRGTVPIPIAVNRGVIPAIIDRSWGRCTVNGGG